MAARVIIKNTTGSDIFVQGSGQNIPANGQREVDPKIYAAYSEAAQGDDLTFINDILVGRLITNVSGSDLSAAAAQRFWETLNFLVITSDVIEKVNFTGQVALSNPTAGELTVNVGGKDDEDFSDTIFSISFSEDGQASNEWLNNQENGIPSNVSPEPILFNSKLVGITFTNSDAVADPGIEIHKSTAGSGSSFTQVYNWSIRDARVAGNRSVSSSNILFNQGDKVAVFLDDEGQNPDDVVVTLYFKVISSPVTDFVEGYTGPTDDDD